MHLHHSLASGFRRFASVSRTPVVAIMLATATAPALMGKEVVRLTPAELYVLDELKAGREADLIKLSPESRVLRHEFVEKLITGGYPDPEIQRRGISIHNAVFKDSLEVSSTDVPFRVWLNFCDFEHGIDLSYTRFARDFSLGGSRFGKPSSYPQGGPDNHGVQAFFEGMKVEGKSDFSGTTFHIPADFTRAEFSADAVFDNVHYDASADFNELSVKGRLFFTRDAFAEGIDLTDANLYELVLQDPTSSVKVDLSQAKIESGFSFKNVQLSSLQAGSLTAHGLITLDGVTSGGRVNLAHSHFENLVIIGFDEWLKIGPRMLNLEGFSFDTLDIGDAKVEPHAAQMLGLLNSPSCPFSPQPYLELEKFLRAHGDVQEADEVYINMRRGQRRKLLWINRIWDFILDKMLGYGKETWRTAVAAICVTILGAIVFSPNQMRWKTLNETQTDYSRFWYSLDQFAPVIDLGDAKNWGPTEDSWTRYYVRLHRIAGWVLLPLAVGAITGLVK